VIDKKFVALTAIEAGVTIWDMAQTLGCQHNVPGCVEHDWIYGQHPSSARAYGEALALDAAFTVGSYAIRRYAPRPLNHLWPLGIGTMIEGHASGIITSEHGYKHTASTFSQSNHDKIRK
jgi:hypothetical protein